MMRSSALRPSPFLLRVAAGLALAVVAWGCADKIAGPDPLIRQTGQIGVFADLGATGVSTLVIQVSGPGIVKVDGSPDTLAFNIPLADGVASGSVQVPAGPDRVITAHAFVGITQTHRGSVIANVFEGNNPTLQITLVPLVGDLPLTVSIGSTIVVVRPLLASLAVGDTLRLTSEIRDHNGQLVNDRVRWATLNPLRATVDTLGLVTMVDTGEVQVVATYGTVGGSSKITGASQLSAVGYHLTWNGTVNSNWSEINNWTPHGLGAARVPSLTDSVVVPAGRPNNPRLDACEDNHAVRDILVEEGAALTTWCGYDLHVYGSAVVRGTITTVKLGPNARIAGRFDDIYVYGAGTQLIDSVSANYVQVDIETGTFALNGKKLTIANDFHVSDGTITMAANDTLIVGGYVNWNGDDHNGLLSGGVVLHRGPSFYAPRYYGTGTSRLVLDRTTAGVQSLSGFDYINNPNSSQINRLEIRNRDGVDICAYIRVADTLKVVSTGTPSAVTGCSSYHVRTLGPVITTANTHVGGSPHWELRDTTGTSLVEGTWSPSVTEFAVAAAAIKATLGYNNLRFTASAALRGDMTISGYLYLNGAATELDLAGNTLQVGQYVETNNGATLKLSTGADSLLVGEYGYFPHDHHIAQKAKLTAGVITFGRYLYGFGFASAGTKVVMTGTSTDNQKYISGLNYDSRPQQQLHDLEIATDATYGLCDRLKVANDLVVKSGAKLQNWCGQPSLTVWNDLVTEATSVVNPYAIGLHSALATSHVAGTWSPEYTDVMVAGSALKPGLAYHNLRFFATNQLSGATTATGHLQVSGAGVDLKINGQTLTVGQHMLVDQNATLTMDQANDAVSIGYYAHFASNTSTTQNAKLIAGTLSIGEYLSGFGFSASGTHTVIMTGTHPTSTQKYITSVNFESRPTQGFQNLEIASGATYGLCERVAVRGTLTVRGGATLQNWCGQPYLRLDGNLVTEVGSNVLPYNVMLNSAFGTDNVLGGFSPTYTSVHSASANGHMKPGLAYQNLQFYAPISLNASLAVNGDLNINGPATVVNLNGNSLTVANILRVQNNATIVMQNGADTLDVTGNVEWNGGGSEAGKLTHGTTIFRGDDVCATNYETGSFHTTVFNRSAGVVRYRCVSSSSTAQLMHNVLVQGQGVTLECHMNVANQIQVQSGATVKQNCGSGTLYVGGDLQGDEGSAVTNGDGYPSTRQLHVVLGSSIGTAHVNGIYSPHFTYFTALNASIKPTYQGTGIDYKHMRIDQSTAFQDTTEIDGGLEIINAAIVDIEHTVVVQGSMDLTSTARVRMVHATDTLVVGYGDPAADLFWDGGDNLTDGTNALLTNGAVKFYGDRFYGLHYKASLPAPLVDQSNHHRFIFASNAAGGVSLEGAPHFANVEIRGLRPITNHSNTVVKDSLIMGASAVLGGTSGYIHTLGDVVTEAASDIMVQHFYVDGPNGTALVGGRFRPTNAYFRAATPAAGAIKIGLEYNNVNFENGQYLLNGATAIAGSMDISTNAQVVVSGKSLSIGGQLSTGSSGGLIMNQSTDNVSVNGLVQWNSPSTTTLTGGTLSVKGNYNNFTTVAASGTHTLVMNGVAAQTINSLSGTMRALNNLVVSGTGNVSFASGIVANGSVSVSSAVAVTGSNSTINGSLSTVVGSSFTHGNLALFGASGTNDVNGVLSVTGLIHFATGSQTIKAGAGISYANMDVSSAATVVGGPLAVPGTLQVLSGGALGVPSGSTLNVVNVDGTLDFLGSSLSAGTLTVRNLGLVRTTADLTPGVWVDFGRIQLNSGGSLETGDRSAGTGGLRYKLSGSPSGFLNGNGGTNGIFGPPPHGQ